MNDYLTGSNTDLSNAFHNFLNKLGRTRSRATACS